VSGLRVETLEALFAGRARVIVTTARALQELADIPAGLADLRLTLAVGDTVRLTDLTGRLDDMGFDRAAMVEAVGEYSVRGGILDLFGFGAPEPVRIEFWGDEIVSIRQFDILDQRSSGDLPVWMCCRWIFHSGSGSGSVDGGGSGSGTAARQRRGGRCWMSSRGTPSSSSWRRERRSGVHADVGAGAASARRGAQARRLPGAAGRAVPEAGHGVRAPRVVRPHRAR
jgi:hypothetical protein